MNANRGVRSAKSILVFIAYSFISRADDRKWKLRYAVSKARGGHEVGAMFDCGCRASLSMNSRRGGARYSFLATLTPASSRSEAIPLTQEFVNECLVWNTLLVRRFLKPKHDVPRMDHTCQGTKPSVLAKNFLAGIVLFGTVI